jgi:hypothetical protein
LTKSETTVAVWLVAKTTNLRGVLFNIRVHEDHFFIGFILNAYNLDGGGGGGGGDDDDNGR